MTLTKFAKDLPPQRCNVLKVSEIVIFDLSDLSQTCDAMNKSEQRIRVVNKPEYTGNDYPYSLNEIV